MEQATLYCPREKLFMNQLLVYRPVLPGRSKSANNIEVQVDILAVQDEQALVRLPNLMAHGDNNTALIDIKYLK